MTDSVIFEDFPANTPVSSYSETEFLKISKQNDLFVIKYIKDKLNYQNFAKLYKYRSVIADGEECIYSMAPTKSQDLDSFIKSNSFCDCTIEEFVEGTMINCFYYGDKWMIASRSSISANCKFSQDCQKTFSDMFYEAMRTCNLEFVDLNVEYNYTFVLQHPENRIVVAFEKPNLVS